MEIVKIEREIREWYENYVRGFHKDDFQYMENINLKYDHTERVVIESRGIGISLGIEVRDTSLLLISALLHDIGRYGQMKKHGTFNDKISENHAKLGVEVIRESGILNKIYPEDQKLIETVVLNHNKKSLPKSMNERERLFCQIVRDADKLDILRILAEHYNSPKDRQNRSIEIDLDSSDTTVSPEIISSLNSGEVVAYTELKNITELKLLQIGWVYDINYLWTYQLLENRGFIEEIVKTVPKKTELTEICDRAVSFLKKRALEAKESGLRGR